MDALFTIDPSPPPFRMTGGAADHGCAVLHGQVAARRQSASV
jgi:hypothetical protein